MENKATKYLPYIEKILRQLEIQKNSTSEGINYTLILNELREDKKDKEVR